MEELEEKVPALDFSILPSVDGWENLAVGNSGIRVQDLQETLISLGFMEGIIDGIFGQRTEASVKAFQESVGVEPTGVVNLGTWFLMKDGSTEPLVVSYPPVFTVEEKFASIIDIVSDPAILECFLDSSWKFNYDEYEGTGAIRKDLDIEPYVESEPAVNRIKVGLELVVYIVEGELIPAILVHSTGAYRPYIQSAKINCDGTYAELQKLFSENEIRGIDIIEDTYLPITEEAGQAITEAESMKIRLHGTSHSYDFGLTGAIEDIQEFVENCWGILVE